MITSTLDTGSFDGQPLAKPNDSKSSLLALGAMAGLIASSAHEAIGHGGACLIAGGSITLLTTTQFHCAGSTPAVDAAGPAANLLLALLSGFALWRLPRLQLPWRLFWAAVLAFNLFWFAGEAFRSLVYAMDDEAAIARTLQWPPWWRILCGLLSVSLYWLTTRLLVPIFRSVGGDTPGTRIVSRISLMYLGATSALLLEGFCSHTGHLSGAFGGALPVGLAGLPVFLSARAAQRLGPTRRTERVVSSTGLLLLGSASLVLFALTQGQGLSINRIH